VATVTTATVTDVDEREERPVTRIVVTGATGFVGGRVAARSRARGDDVIAVGRRTVAALDALGVEQRTAALTDAEELRPILEDQVDGPADAVVHAAATVGPDLDSARRVNRDGTRAVVEAARAAGVRRFVHLSTTSVYDLDALGDVEVDEDAPLVTPASWPDGDPVPYALTKAEAETEIVRAIGAGMSAQVLRPPAVLGAGPTSTWGTRVPRRYRDGELPPRAPATTFGFVHVEDLVDVILASVEHDSTHTCNVVGGHTTFGAYLAALRRFLPGPAATRANSSERPWQGHYASARLEEALGLQPSRSFEEAMEEIAASWAEGEPEAS
jgi:2-alkyl-3-oxoalkanoate reductase